MQLVPKGDKGYVPSQILLSTEDYEFLKKINKKIRPFLSKIIEEKIKELRKDYA